MSAWARRRGRARVNACGFAHTRIRKRRTRTRRAGPPRSRGTERGEDLRVRGRRARAHTHTQYYILKSNAGGGAGGGVREVARKRLRQVRITQTRARGSQGLASITCKMKREEEWRAGGRKGVNRGVARQAHRKTSVTSARIFLRKSQFTHECFCERVMTVSCLQH